MPFHYEIDKAENVLCVVFESPLTDDCLREYYRTVHHVIDRVEPAAFISDFSRIYPNTISSDVVRELASLRPIIPDPKPRVLIAGSDATYGLARMFQLAGQEREMLQIVKSFPEALRLLRLPKLNLELLSEAEPTRPGSLSAD